MALILCKREVAKETYDSLVAESCNVVNLGERLLYNVENRFRTYFVRSASYFNNGRLFLDMRVGCVVLVVSRLVRSREHSVTCVRCVFEAAPHFMPHQPYLFASWFPTGICRRVAKHLRAVSSARFYGTIASTDFQSVLACCMATILCF